MTNPAPERFHVTVSSVGRPIMHGWWAAPATARNKFRDWIGEYSKMPEVYITLTERAGTDELLLTSWPDGT